MLTKVLTKHEALRMRLTTAVVHEIKFIWQVGILIKIIEKFIDGVAFLFDQVFKQEYVHFGSIGQETRHLCSLMWPTKDYHPMISAYVEYSVQKTAWRLLALNNTVCRVVRSLPWPRFKVGRVNRASAGTTGEGSRVREGEEKEELATFGWCGGPMRMMMQLTGSVLQFWGGRRRC